MGFQPLGTPTVLLKSGALSTMEKWLHMHRHTPLKGPLVIWQHPCIHNCIYIFIQCKHYTILTIPASQPYSRGAQWLALLTCSPGELGPSKGNICMYILPVLAWVSSHTTKNTDRLTWNLDCKLQRGQGLMCGAIKVN